MLHNYDALIIGGGPGGAAAATFLARAGRSVLVLEKEHFPRFHIGESLLPYNRELFEQMGVLPTLEAAGFPIKYGAQFHLANGASSLKLKFRNGRFTRLTTAYQVERAKFDHILLQHARSCGAEVREGWTVSQFDSSGSNVSVQARNTASGAAESYRGSFLVDASGRANFTGNTQGLRIAHPRHKKVAVFGHFEGVQLDPGDEGGDTLIVRLKDKWFWLIPISSTKVSVGCVLDQAELSSGTEKPSELFHSTWRSSPVMRDRMSKARLLGSIQTTNDFSYYNRKLAGPRLLRVGDAAGFMDPIFSAGVYLAMFSGKLAANSVLDSLAAGDDGAARFRVYESRVFRAMRLYWRMVEGFYTQSFMELFLQPRPKFNMPDAVTAILAGELDGGWALKWRHQLFLLFTRVQSRFPIVPRLSW